MSIALTPKLRKHRGGMDLLKWIKSLDDVLFELMSWLVFWPATLLRTLAQPIAMMRYADAQLKRAEEEQYSEALSPPVFLILTLIIVHLVSMALGQPDEIMANQRGIAGMIDNDASAVAARLMLFATFPLVFSVGLLLAKRRKLDRNNLQLPFYAQCYPAAVFAAALGVAAQVGLLRIGPAGLSSWLMIGAALWFTSVEAIWLKRVQRFGWPAALALAVAGMIAGMAIVIAAALLLLGRA